MSGEKTFVCIFILLNLTVPFWMKEFYPFTTVPLFTTSPQLYCRYEITGWDGRPFSERTFDLQRSDWGDKRGWPTALKNHRGYDEFGVLLSPEQLTRQVQQVLRLHREVRGVTLAQHVYGPVGRGVGEVNRVVLRIPRGPARVE